MVCVWFASERKYKILFNYIDKVSSLLKRCNGQSLLLSKLPQALIREKSRQTDISLYIDCWNDGLCLLCISFFFFFFFTKNNYNFNYSFINRHFALHRLLKWWVVFAVYLFFFLFFFYFFTKNNYNFNYSFINRHFALHPLLKWWVVFAVYLFFFFLQKTTTTLITALLLTSRLQLTV